MVGGAAPHGRPQITQEGHVERAGERRTTWAGGEEEIMDGLPGRALSDVWHHGGWSPAPLDPWVWYSIVCKGDCMVMAARVKEEENASKT